MITLSCELIFSETRREGKSRSQPHITKQPHAHGSCLRLCSQGDPDWNPGFQKNILGEPNMLMHTYTHAHKVHTYAHTIHICNTSTYPHTCMHTRVNTQGRCVVNMHAQQTRVHSCMHWQFPRARACTHRHTCTSGPWRQATPSWPRMLSCVQWTAIELYQAMGSIVSSWPFTFGKSQQDISEVYTFKEG